MISEIYGFLMISGRKEVNQFIQIHVILEEKSGDEPLPKSHKDDEICSVIEKLPRRKIFGKSKKDCFPKLSDRIIHLVRCKILRKTNISYPLIRTHVPIRG